MICWNQARSHAGYILSNHANRHVLSDNGANEPTDFLPFWIRFRQRGDSSAPTKISISRSQRFLSLHFGTSNAL